MHIRSFHIDGYGIFSDVGVEALAPGLSIFVGQNEAGKSTCLDFFRSVLTGYPDPRQKKGVRNFAPLRGGLAGGSLCVETRQHGLVQITRRPQGGAGGALTLTDAQGTVLDPALLGQLLGGVTREVYRNVFGFSLSELQSFDSLNSPGVRHALYGASFGTGLRTPGQALKALEEGMDSLFKGGGSKPRLNAGLREWEQLRHDMDEVEQEYTLYDNLMLERDTTRAALEALRERRLAQEAERRTAERQIGAWKLWDEWRTLQERMARLESVPDSFPQGGAERFERAREALLAAQRDRQSQQDVCDRLQARYAGIAVEPALCALLPRLTALAERKASYRNAVSALPSQHDALERAKAELARLLASLGPDWDCERIRATDRSLFAREELEKQASLMQTALATHATLVSGLEKANRNAELAEQALEQAQQALDSLPLPAAEVSSAERDVLRQSLSRMESLQQILPEKRQALKAAHATFNRAYTPLNLRKGTDPAHALDELGKAQGQALPLADAARDAARMAAALEQDLARAQKTAEKAQERIDRLRQQRAMNRGPSREAIDIRARALRSLRNLSTAFTGERERMEETEARLAALVPPAPWKSIPLMSVGLAIVACGAAMLAAYWYWNITALPLVEGITLPVNLWSGYLVILCGVGFLAGGVPRTSPETPQYIAERDNLQARKESSQMRLTELEAQIQEQCVLAEVVNADPVTLDATELVLEHERERCVADERLTRDIELLEEEYNTLHEAALHVQLQYNDASAEVQQSRKRWHEFLQGCHVEVIPAPDGAPAYFAHADGARMALDTMHALEEEIASLHGQLEEACAHARQVPAVLHKLCDGPDAPPATDAADDADPKGAAGTEADTAPVGPDGSPAQVAALVRAITLVLDDCREADAAEEERLKAVAAVHSAELHQERAGTAQGEAMDNVRRSEDACGAAREGWSAMLEGLGLGAELSPGTVREALECMERCLAAEADVARQQDDITRLTRERDALITPLRQIAKEWCNASGDTSVLPGEAAEDTDWAELLDTLLHRAQAMSEAARERKQVGCDLEEQRDRLKAATAAANDAEATVAELLRLGGADDAEGYLRRAEAVRQRADMLQRAGDLENTLSRAAGDMPLEAFLESFATVDEHEREVQLRESERQIAAMLAEEQELGAKEAALSGRITTLATADRLGGLRQQEADLRASLDSDARQWSRFALAHALIDAAKARFERERQPQVVRTAAEIFRAITDGRWAGLAASLEDNSISVVPPHGEAVPPEQLSRGTQEQIYLAMRLGHIRSHTEQAGSLPLIMDDILVNFDPERARRTAASLLRFTSGDMGGHPQQVLFFTCHPHIADMLQEIMPQSGRYAVHDGTITPA